MARTVSSRFRILGPVIRPRIARGLNRARPLQKKLTLDLGLTPGGLFVDSSLLRISGTQAGQSRSNVLRVDKDRYILRGVARSGFPACRPRRLP